MAFPTTIDSFTPISGTTLVATDDHANRHNVTGSAVTAIENKISLGAGSAALNQIIVGSGAGTSAWGSVWNLAQLGTPTIGTPLITGGTSNSQVVGTPTITGGVVNNATFGSPTITGGTLTLPQIKTHSLGSAAFTGTASTTQNLDLSTATRFVLTFPNTAGSITLTTSNPTANQPFFLEAIQGTAGNGTLNFFANITWLNSGTAVPTQGTTPSRKATYGFITTGASSYDGYVVGKAE